MSTKNHRTGSVFRVDKFVVPVEARDEILSKARMTHELLRQQEGFVQDFLLEQFSGPGEFNIVTVVEWENQDAVDKVVPIVKAAHERIAFSAQETIARLGVKADIANYQRVPEAYPRAAAPSRWASLIPIQ